MPLITKQSKKVFLFSFIWLSVLPAFVFSQQQIVFNGDYVVINGGGGGPWHTPSNPIYLVVDNPNPSALVDPSGSGWIVSEAEYNQVAWNIGNSSGNYLVPFGDSTQNYIPLTVNITGAGDSSGSLRMATYNCSTWDNLKYIPTGVSNMYGNTSPDNSSEVADRFWIIDAGNYVSKPTTNMIFTYIPNEITAAGNNITEANLFMQRFDSSQNTWADWYGAAGTDNNVSKTVLSGSITPSNLDRSWVLVDHSSPMGITKVTKQPPQYVTVCSMFDTAFSVIDTGIGMNFQWEVNTGSGFTNVINGGIYSGATTPTLVIKGASPSMTGDKYYCIIGNGMTSSDTVNITVNLPPTIVVAANPSEICRGRTVSLSASGADSYNWYTPSGLSCSTCSTTNNTPTVSTTYGVVGKDSIGCVDTAQVTVKVDTMPVPIISNTQKICEGSNALISASGGSSYSWTPNNSLNDSSIFDPVASPTITTTYIVSVANGACHVNDSVIVIVNPLPNGTSAAKYTVIDIGNSTPITATVASSYSFTWQPSSSLSCDNCPDPIANPTLSTTYTLFVTDSAGCSVADTVTIKVEDICGEIFVPGAFSPNGDGHNDILYVSGNCIEELDFIIFDRWGNKVFEGNDPHAGWDGRYNGQMMNTGTFGYYLKAKEYNGKVIERKGNVGLVR
jgi:gliding motility-associated-like protein